MPKSTVVWLCIGSGVIGFGAGLLVSFASPYLDSFAQKTIPSLFEQNQAESPAPDIDRLPQPERDQYAIANELMRKKSERLFNMPSSEGDIVPPLDETPETSSFKPDLLKLSSLLNKEVEVFGSSNCQFTQKMMSDLQANNIPYRFIDIEAEENKSDLNQMEFESGISGAYTLPLVSVNGQSLAKPSGITSEEVIKALSEQNPVTKFDRTKKVVIYSRPGDELTTRVMKSLERRQLPYSFKDVNSPEVSSEVFRLVKSEVGGSINLPVVIADGNVMVAPSFEQLVNAYTVNGNVN
jgi:glutaredoxin